MVFAGATDNRCGGRRWLFPRGIAAITCAHAVGSDFVDHLRDCQGLAFGAGGRRRNSLKIERHGPVFGRGWNPYESLLVITYIMI